MNEKSLGENTYSIRTVDNRMENLLEIRRGWGFYQATNLPTLRVYQ